MTGETRELEENIRSSPQAPHVTTCAARVGIVLRFPYNIMRGGERRLQVGRKKGWMEWIHPDQEKLIELEEEEEGKKNGNFGSLPGRAAILTVGR